MKAIEFENDLGKKISVLPDRVDAVIELETGCQIAIGVAIYRVTMGYEQAKALIWPIA